jgi:hypothetical protein
MQSEFIRIKYGIDKVVVRYGQLFLLAHTLLLWSLCSRQHRLCLLYVIASVAAGLIFFGFELRPDIYQMHQDDPLARQ